MSEYVVKIKITGESKPREVYLKDVEKSSIAKTVDRLFSNASIISFVQK